MIAASIWHNDLDQTRFDCTPEQWVWLTSTDSLTARLRRLSGNTARLELHSAGWGSAYPEERELLSELAGPVWVREIIHSHQQSPWIWGRAVIPEQTLQKTGLDAGGTQSIGDSLFHDPMLKRTQLALTRLSPQHPYYHSAAQYLQNSPEPPWARRSILWFRQHPLLVAEIFLPDFFHYAQNI